LFPLAVGLLGDAAAAIASGRDTEDPSATSRDTLRFAAVFFDAYLNAHLGEELTIEFSVLCACAYYLADNPGSANVIIGRMTTPSPREHGELFCAVYALLLGVQVSADPEGKYHSEILELFRRVELFYALEDNPALLEYASGIRRAAYASANPRDILHSDLLVALCKRRAENSARRILPLASDLPLSAWRSALLKSTFSRELWPAQRKICDARVLAGRSAVIQMPTSAGKTRATDFIIRSAFLSHRTSLAVVVAPFRALCHDIRSDLTKSFAGEDIFLDEVTDKFEFDIDMETIFRSKTVLILTPEKLLYILRRDPEFAEQIGLIIYDEGHQFDSPTRGPTYELLLSSLKLSVSADTQVVLISAVISNAAEIAEWLVRDSNAVIASGELSPTARSVAFTSWRDARGQLRYVSPIDPEDEEFFVPRVIEAVPLPRKPKERKHRQFPTSDGPDIGLYMALKLGQNGGVAVFCGRKDTASNLCTRAVDVLERTTAFTPPVEYSDQSEATKIAKLFQAHLGESASLAKAAKLGIFPHHSSIPSGARLSVEHAMKHNMARVVVCTSTLAQGVNLPIKYLLVTSTQQGIDRISVRDFHNLIGRAGRSGMHTEGSIIFAAPEIFDGRKTYRERWRWTSAKELLNSSNSEPCASSILSVFEPFVYGQPQREVWLSVETLAALTFDAEPTESALVERQAQNMSDRDLRSYRYFIRIKASVIQKVAVYLISHMAAEDEADPHTLEAKVAALAINTLAYHLSPQSVRKELVSLFLAAFHQVKARATDEIRQAIRKSPLAPPTVVALSNWISEGHEHLEASLSEGKLLRDVFDQMLRASNDAGLSNLKNRDVAIHLVEGWIEGASYEALHNMLETAGERIGKRRYKVDDVVNLCEGSFGYNAAMAVATMADVAQPINEVLSKGLAFLQRQLKYGLLNSPAITFYELGFSDRVVAASLAQIFPNVVDRASAHATLVIDQARARAQLEPFPSYFTAVLNEICR
jgi:replicative superfamily II helicase